MQSRQVKLVQSIRKKSKNWKTTIPKRRNRPEAGRTDQSSEHSCPDFTATGSTEYSPSANTTILVSASNTTKDDLITLPPVRNKDGVIYSNIRGLFPKSNQSKVPYLCDLAKTKNSPLICLTETHLTHEILDAEISINGYNLFRSDRQKRSHGGVCTYVRKDLAAKIEMQFSDSYVDFFNPSIKINIRF